MEHISEEARGKINKGKHLKNTQKGCAEKLTVLTK
jgi:hypothetical protein